MWGGNGLLLLQSHGPHTFLSSNQGQDLTMALDDITSYSHQGVPHYPRVSSSASSYCANILVLLSLFHFSSINLLIFVLLRFSGCLRSSQEWSLEFYVLPMTYSTGQGTPCLPVSA